MNEWGVLSVIITLVGFLAVLMPPLLKLNTSIVSLRESVKTLNNSVDDLNQNNTKDHRRIWNHLEDIDDKLHDYDTRLTVIEREVNRYNG